MAKNVQVKKNRGEGTPGCKTVKGPGVNLEEQSLSAAKEKRNKTKGNRKTMSKTIKKMMALALAMVMVLAMSVTVFAANADKDSGKGGEGTLTITAAHKDQTYELYRVFEAVVNATDNTKVSYKPLAGKTIPTNDYFKVENGYIIVQDAAKDATDDTALSAGAVAWLTANYATIGEKVTDVTPTEEGNQKVTGLPFGYYYVTTTTGTAISVDTTNKDATVADKNPGTSIDKTITGVADGSVTADKDNALAQVGTTVNYEVRIPIAANAKTYKFTDVMTDGLTYKAGSMKVYVVEKDAAVAEDATGNLAEGTDAATKYGTLTEAAGATGENADVTIAFNDAMLAANNGKDIVLHYQATVNANAVVATGSNPNTATIHWGHETDTLKDEDDAKVYSAKVTVKKVDGNSAALEGAGFKLKDKTSGKWYKNTNGIISWVDAEADGTEIFPVKGTQANPEYDADAAAAAEAAGETYDVPATIEGTDAVASFDGLKDGTYTLVETTVPDGYNKADDTDVTIKPASTNNLTTELTVESTVTNNQGTELPSTGGIGTTLFYVIGAILVLGAGILLVTRRRMNAN